MAENRIPLNMWDEEPIYDSRTFSIHVGILWADQVPHYLVINKETGVVEYEAENIVFAREWVAHVQPKVDELDGLAEAKESNTIANLLKPN